MYQVDRLLLDLHRIQQRLAEAPAMAEAAANRATADGRDRYAVTTGYLTGIIQTAVERLDEVGKGLHKATRDPEPPEPGEADAYAVLELLDEAITTSEARQGWERALLAVLRDPRQRQVLIDRLTERVAEHPDRCPECGRELEEVTYYEHHPAGTEVRREAYCPVCKAGELALARKMAAWRAG